MPKPTYFNLSDEKKGRIRSAVYELFSRLPYEKVTTRLVTQKANIPMGSLYQYFENKDEMYLYFQMEIIAEVNEQLDREGAHVRMESAFLDGKEGVLDDKFDDVKEAFIKSIFYAPDTVLKKLYFDMEYSSLSGMTHDFFKSYFSKEDDVDQEKLEFALYMMDTLEFNYMMYLREKGISDPEEIKETGNRLYNSMMYGKDGLIPYMKGFVRKKK